jgi:hypothetical protein
MYVHHVHRVELHPFTAANAPAELLRDYPCPRQADDGIVVFSLAGETVLAGSDPHQGPAGRGFCDNGTVEGTRIEEHREENRRQHAGTRRYMKVLEASAVEPVGSDLALYRVDVRAEHYSATPLREVLGRDPTRDWRTKHGNTTMHLYERT